MELLIEIKLKEPISSSLGYIFDFFIKSNLDNNSSYDDFYLEAEKFINLYPKQDEAIISSFSFFDSNLFIFPESMSDSLKSEFMINLDGFLSTIRDIIIENRPALDVPPSDLERKVSPPYKAYHFHGNNNLDINMNSSGYYYSLDI